MTAGSDPILRHRQEFSMGTLIVSAKHENEYFIECFYHVLTGQAMF
jgi:hypothetical protein